jgi:hypothetical protein
MRLCALQSSLFVEMNLRSLKVRANPIESESLQNYTSKVVNSAEIW